MYEQNHTKIKMGDTEEGEYGGFYLLLKLLRKTTVSHNGNQLYFSPKEMERHSKFCKSVDFFEFILDTHWGEDNYDYIKSLNIE